MKFKSHFTIFIICTAISILCCPDLCAGAFFAGGRIFEECESKKAKCNSRLETHPFHEKKRKNKPKSPLSLKMLSARAVLENGFSTRGEDVIPILELGLPKELNIYLVFNHQYLNNVDQAVIKAAQYNLYELIPDLMNLGANLGAGLPSDCRQQALDEAVRLGHQETVSVLLSYGAANHERWDSWLHPLVVAVRNKNTVLQNMLIDHLATLDEKNNTSLKQTALSSALREAAANGRVDVVRMLVSLGADVTIASFGETAADCARKNGHLEIVQLLEKSQ